MTNKSTINIKQWWLYFWQGLQNGLAPMLSKEMRSRTRGWRSPALLTAYLSVLSLGTVAFLWVNLKVSSNISPQVGLIYYGILVFGLVLLLSFIAPAISAGAISGERERRTYDLLLVTKASLIGIVLGKWLASVAYLLFLVLAALPLLALVYLFGGVPIGTMLMAILLFLLTGLGYGALGLCLSALLKRSQAATIISLVLVFILIFGLPVVAGIALSGSQDMAQEEYYGEQYNYTPPKVPWYLYASPLSALTDAMPNTGDLSMGQGIPLIGALMNELMFQFQPRYDRHAYYRTYPGGYSSGGTPVKEQKKSGIASWPFWARFAMNQGLLVILSLTIAVFAIAPRKPWHRYRIWRQQKASQT